MDKYCLTVNWHGEIHKIYTTAKTEDDAFGNCVVKLATKLTRTTSSIYCYLRDADRFSIRRVDSLRPPPKEAEIQGSLL